VRVGSRWAAAVGCDTVLEAPVVFDEDLAERVREVPPAERRAGLVSVGFSASNGRKLSDRRGRGRRGGSR